MDLQAGNQLPPALAKKERKVLSKIILQNLRENSQCMRSLNLGEVVIRHRGKIKSLNDLEIEILSEK